MFYYLSGFIKSRHFVGKWCSKWCTGWMTGCAWETADLRISFMLSEKSDCESLHDRI